MRLEDRGSDYGGRAGTNWAGLTIDDLHRIGIHRSIDGLAALLHIAGYDVENSPISLSLDSSGGARMRFSLGDSRTLPPTDAVANGRDELNNAYAYGTDPWPAPDFVGALTFETTQIAGCPTALVLPEGYEEENNVGSWNRLGNGSGNTPAGLVVVGFGVSLPSNVEELLSALGLATEWATERLSAEIASIWGSVDGRLEDLDGGGLLGIFEPDRWRIRRQADEPEDPSQVKILHEFGSRVYSGAFQSQAHLETFLRGLSAQKPLLPLVSTKFMSARDALEPYQIAPPVPLVNESPIADPSPEHDRLIADLLQVQEELLEAQGESDTCQRKRDFHRGTFYDWMIDNSKILEFVFPDLDSARAVGDSQAQHPYVPMLLFILVGHQTFDQYGPEPAPTEPSDSYVQILAALAAIEPFDLALQEKAIAIHWLATGPTERADINGIWVLDQLRRTDLDLPPNSAPLLTDGVSLPFTNGRPVLPVVVYPNQQTAPSGDSDPATRLFYESASAGRYPFYVIVDGGRAYPSARAIARAMGKVLGLGDESNDWTKLSGPDFWGRSFPNLWFSERSAFDSSQPKDQPPWPDTDTIIPQEGGFGSDAWRVLPGASGNADEVSVWRPEASCIMGDGDLFCRVCQYHLERMFGVVDRAADSWLDLVEFESDDPSVTPSVLTRVKLDGEVLWEQIQPRRTVDGFVIDPASTTILHGGRVAVTFYPDGLVVKTSVVQDLTSLGYTVSLEMETYLDGVPADPATLIKTLEEDPLYPVDPGSNVYETLEHPQVLGGSPIVRWRIEGAIWTPNIADETFGSKYLSPCRTRQYFGWMDRLGDGYVSREDIDEAYLAWADWSWWHEGDPGTPGQLSALERIRAGRSRQLGLTGPNQDTVGMAFGSNSQGNMLMTPLPDSGVSAPALSLLIAGRVPMPGEDDWRGFLRELAYVQATGVPGTLPLFSTRWPGWRVFFDPQLGALWTFVGTRAVQERATSAVLRYTTKAIPDQVARLHSVLDEADFKKAKTAEEALRLQRWNDVRTNYTPQTSPAAADALVVKAALRTIRYAPYGLADLTGIIGNAYERVLLTMVRWALEDSIEALIGAYPHGSNETSLDALTDDLVASGGASITNPLYRHAGWKAFIARVRALLGSAGGMRLALVTREHLVSVHERAIIAAASRLTADELVLLKQGTADIDRVLEIIEEACAVWDGAIPAYLGVGQGKPIAELELARTISTVAMSYGRSPETKLAEGAAKLWRKASAKYIIDRGAVSVAPALRVLAETPPDWRDAFFNGPDPAVPVDLTTPGSNGNSAYNTDALALFTELRNRQTLPESVFIKRIVQLLLASKVRDVHWPDVRAAALALGAVIKETQTTHDACVARFADFESEHPDWRNPSDPKHVNGTQLQGLVSDTLVIRDSIERTVFDPATLSIIDSASFESEHYARRAELRWALGIRYGFSGRWLAKSEASYHRARLLSQNYHRDFLAIYAAVPYKLMGALRNDPAIMAHLSRYGEKLPDHLQQWPDANRTHGLLHVLENLEAVNVANADLHEGESPVEPAFEDILKMVAHRAFELKEHFEAWTSAGTFDASRLDRPIAALIMAASQLVEPAIDRRPLLGADTQGFANWLAAVRDSSAWRVLPVTVDGREFTLDDVWVVYSDGAQDESGLLTLEKLAWAVAVRVVDGIEYIWYPECFAVFLRLRLGREQEILHGLQVDGHAMMRSALAEEIEHVFEPGPMNDPSMWDCGTEEVCRDPNDPNADPSLPSCTDFELFHKETLDLVRRSVEHWRRFINWESAESILDTLYRFPRFEPGTTLVDLTGAYLDMEIRAAYARARQLSYARGGLSGAFFYGALDALSSEGPEFDEVSLTLDLLIARARSNNSTLTLQQLFARVMRLSNEARAIRQAYDADRRQIAEVGAMVAATTIAVGLSVGSGGLLAGPCGGLLMGAFGVGAASGAAAVTRYVVAGSGFISGAEQTQNLANDGVDAVIDIAVGGALKGVAFLARSTTTPGKLANRIADVMYDTSTVQSTLGRVGVGAVQGLMEGMAGGGISALVQTAMDETVWLQSTERQRFAFWEALLFGLTVGAAAGAAGGAIGGGFVEESATARLRSRCRGWLDEYGPPDLVVQGSDWDIFEDARRMLDEGDVTGAELRLDGALGRSDLREALLAPILAKGMARLQAAVADVLPNITQQQLAEIEGKIKIVLVDSRRLRPEAREGAEFLIRAVATDPPEVDPDTQELIAEISEIIIRVDESATNDKLVREGLHAVDLVADPQRQRELWRHWKLLTEAALADWDNSNALINRAVARRAYVELEIRNDEQYLAVLESRWHPDEMPESVRAEWLEARELYEWNLAERDLLDSGQVTLDEFDDPPRLTGRGRRFPDPLSTLHRTADKSPREATSQRQVESFVVAHSNYEPFMPNGLKPYPNSHGSPGFLATTDPANPDNLFQVSVKGVLRQVNHPYVKQRKNVNFNGVSFPDHAVLVTPPVAGQPQFLATLEIKTPEATFSEYIARPARDKPTVGASIVNQFGHLQQNISPRCRDFQLIVDLRFSGQPWRDAAFQLLRFLKEESIKFGRPQTLWTSFRFIVPTNVDVSLGSSSVIGSRLRDGDPILDSDGRWIGGGSFTIPRKINYVELAGWSNRQLIAFVNSAQFDNPALPNTWIDGNWPIMPRFESGR